jgi:hypothetical protein
VLEEKGREAVPTTANEGAILEEVKRIYPVQVGPSLLAVLKVCQSPSDQMDSLDRLELTEPVVKAERDTCMISSKREHQSIGKTLSIS